MRNLVTRLHLTRRTDGERGQIFAFVAMVLVILCGMAAIAIDYGSYATHRRDLQNAADSIALAASQELPNSGQAISTAHAYATKNGIPIGDVSINIVPQSPSQPNPEVEVTIDQGHDFTFAKVIGVNSADVSAFAAAIKTSPAGGSGVVPLSVTEDALGAATLGAPVVLKYDSNNITTGNTGPIRIDGGGSGNCTDSASYCDGVKFGSDNVVCAEGTNTTYCSGPSQVDTQPGNVVGGTRDAIEWRMDNTDAACDTFDETFEDDPNSSDPGDYHITQECNPFLPGGPDSYRIMIIPIIEELCNGSCEVTITGFALFFLEGFANGPPCTGNDCELIGRFVAVNQNVGMLAGTFDEDALNSFVRLVE